MEIEKGRNYQTVGGTYDKPIKYVILGPVKCGTCSLQEYYRAKYPEFECIRAEILWRDDGFKQWEEILKEYPNAIPVIIKRNLVNAIWSYFRYFKQRPKYMKLKEFLKMPIDNDNHGILPNIIDGYNFEKWIGKWSKYNPIIIDLEEIKKLSDFPTVNKTSNNITQKDEKIIMEGITA